MIDQLKENRKYLQVYTLWEEGKIHYSYLKLRIRIRRRRRRREYENGKWSDITPFFESKQQLVISCDHKRTRLMTSNRR